MVQSEDDFRAGIRAKYASLFQLYRELLELLEGAVATPRSFADAHPRTQDMLFLQAFKAVQSIGILCEYALVEDAATVARRLLEVAIWSAYVQAKGNTTLQAQRAEDLLARLWIEWPSDLRHVIPMEERAAYEAIYIRLSSQWKNGKPPHLTIRSRFEDVGAADLYEADYSLLSAIAHGVPPMLVHAYASDVIPIHDGRLVPAVLRATLRYGLASTTVWNSVFGVIEDAQLQSLVSKTVEVSR